MEFSRRAALKMIATEFLEGKLEPLETALAMAAFKDEAPEDLRGSLAEMVGVASETDDIPLGSRRELWHQDSRPVQDRRHDEAQAWAKPIVREACERIVLAL